MTLQKLSNIRMRHGVAFRQMLHDANIDAVTGTPEPSEWHCDRAVPGLIYRTEFFRRPKLLRVSSHS
jgi:hypothetical protein